MTMRLADSSGPLDGPHPRRWTAAWFVNWMWRPTMTWRGLLIIAAIALFLAAGVGAMHWADTINVTACIAFGLAASAGSRLP